MNLTVPCIPPGTSTTSPIPMSRPSAPILLEGGDAPPTRAFKDAFRWNAVLAVRDKFGEDSAAYDGEGERWFYLLSHRSAYLQRRSRLAKPSGCLERHSDRLAAALLQYENTRAAGVTGKAGLLWEDVDVVVTRGPVCHEVVDF
jgi:hypothetical protein